MKTASHWIGFATVLAVLYLADMNHLPSTHFNAFLFILMGIVTGLVILLKTAHRPSDREEPQQKGKDHLRIG